MADDSHKISRLIFYVERKTSSATNFAWCFKSLHCMYIIMYNYPTYDIIKLCTLLFINLRCRRYYEAAIKKQKAKFQISGPSDRQKEQ